jgi:predicted dehydrogenase
MVEAVRPEVIHIVTPPSSHTSVASTALAKDCHIYVEKPFAETAADAESILREAARRNLLVCAGHQLLFEAPSRLAAELLPALGDLVHVESYFSFRTVRRTPDGRAPLRADLQLLDILPHPVYLLLNALERAADGATALTDLRVGPAGTVHALVSRGALTANLTVTLEGRPVESYLRLVGKNGSIYADFVRGTVQRHIGPGTSGIDKLLAPYRTARQLVSTTTKAMARRVLARQRSYPGLTEVFEEFYRAIRTGGSAPVTPSNILDTVRICEQAGHGIRVIPGTQPTRHPSYCVGLDVVSNRRDRGSWAKALASSPCSSRPPGHSVFGGARTVVRAGRHTRSGIPGGRCWPAGIMNPRLSSEKRLKLSFTQPPSSAGGWEQHQQKLDQCHRGRSYRGRRQRPGVSPFRALSAASLFFEVRAYAPIRDRYHPRKPGPGAFGPYVWGKFGVRAVLRLHWATESWGFGNDCAFQGP